MQWQDLTFLSTVATFEVQMPFPKSFIDSEEEVLDLISVDPITEDEIIISKKCGDNY